MYYALAVVLIVIGVFGVYIAIPTLCNAFLRIRFKKRIKASGRFYFTFDDGPEPGQTNRIMDQLDRFGAKATFFLLGDKARKHPELVEEILHRGHVIGEHSFRHRHPWHTGPFRAYRDLVQGGGAIVHALKGRESSLFRPPYGKFNLATILYMVLRKKKSVFWCIDTTDNEGTAVDDIVETVFPQLAPGNVILMHDGKENGPAPDARTVEALGLILAEVERRGIPFGKLDADLVS